MHKKSTKHATFCPGPLGMIFLNGMKNMGLQGIQPNGSGTN